MQTISQIWNFGMKPWLQKPKEQKKFHQWLKEWPINPLQPGIKNKNIALVRLDDIGDYILFRPYLILLKQSEAFKNYRITLFGNEVWRPLFEAYDSSYVDEACWIKKGEWFASSAYREQIKNAISAKTYEAVWLPSRTRHFFLEDVVASCFITSRRICTGLTYSSYPLKEQFNFLDGLGYSVIEPKKEENLHELDFNRTWMETACQTRFTSSVSPDKKKEDTTKILLFPGGSAGSKRWPWRNFAQLAVELQSRYPQASVVVAGGTTENPIAQSIMKYALTKGVHLENLCGKTSLLDLWALIGSCTLVISNDTSAAHMAALIKTPLVVLANGNKKGRFFPYPVQFSQIITLYPGTHELPNLYPLALPIKQIKTSEALDASIKLLSS